jgi:hypothetical protein
MSAVINFLSQFFYSAFLFFIYIVSQSIKCAWWLSSVNHHAFVTEFCCSQVLSLVVFDLLAN